jgi:AraC-like DNA-binding protein
MGMQLLIFLSPFCVGVGYLLAIQLFRLRHQNPACAALALYVGALATLIMNDALHLVVQTSPRSITRWIFDSCILLPGPALFLYIRRATDESDRALRWPLVPFCISLLACSIRAAWSNATGGEPFLGYPLYNKVLPWPERFMVIAIAAFNGAFIIASYLQVERWRKQVVDFFSQDEKLRYGWFLYLLVLAAALLLGWMFSWGFNLLVSGFLTVLLVLGNFIVLAFRATRQEITKLPSYESVLVAAARDDVRDTTSNAYAKSVLSPERVTQMLSSLHRVMSEQKLFLEDDLNAAELARALEISQHHLSQVLNNHLKTNFYDYVNNLRCEEVARCFKDPRYDGQSILDIALQSGFASKSSFNVKFRHVYGQTPSEFRKRVQSETGRERMLN